MNATHIVFGNVNVEANRKKRFQLIIYLQKRKLDKLYI